MLPKPYTVPTEGPVGRYLEAMGQHPWRPAHIHFKVTAPGHAAAGHAGLLPRRPLPRERHHRRGEGGARAARGAGGRPPGLPVRHRAAAGRLTRFASCSLGERRFAALVDGDTVRPLEGITELGRETPAEVLADPPLSDERVPLADVTLLPVVPHPGKIVCVGLNYRAHVDEGVYEVPDYPALFSEVRRALVGAGAAGAAAAGVRGGRLRGRARVRRRAARSAGPRARRRSRRSPATRSPTT